VPPADIERTSMPSVEDFFATYVYPQRPVVLTDVFAGQEIDSIRTVDDAVDAWGGMQIRLQEEYSRAGTAPPAPAPMSLRDYVDLVRADPGTPLCCTEYETPARVLAAFELPSVCRSRDTAGQEILGLPRKYGDHDLVTNTFIANRGNIAHLHFDGDQREVLLHQVYGRKRVLLFPPASARHLRTLDGPFTRPSLAGLYLEHLDLDEQLAIVEAAGGYHTVLEPGETLHIPMLMWHHVEYLEDAMSFNLRFGRNRIGRFLSLDNFHRDPYIQNVASTMVGPDDTLGAFDAIVDEITATYLRPAVDLRGKVRQVRSTFRELCVRLCPDAHAEELCPPEREEEQITRIVEGTDMAGGMKYADPAVVARARPTGPSTTRQLEILESMLGSKGYADEVARRVIGNRTGKQDLDQLTKAEVAQLIDYLTTPGATW
jgi:lysine-specific demethylase 8